MIKMNNKKIGSFCYALLAILFSLAASAASADLAISQEPLFLGKRADPNIMFVLDDSGSMKRSYLPDGLRWCEVDHENNGSFCGWTYKTPARRAQSHLYNKQYYDPKAKYEVPPALKRHHQCGEKTSWECAPKDGYDPNSGHVNLGSEFVYEWEEYGALPVIMSAKGAGHYYALAAGKTGVPYKNSDWVKKLIPTEDQQNFANWYSYYRTREFAARAGIGLAFDKLSDDVRVGFGAINKFETIVDGKNTKVIISGVRPFNNENKARFFERLYGRNAVGQTPLRLALDAVGIYYQRTDDKGPWGNDPETGSSTVTSDDQLACRQSATVLMTDGYWSGGENSTDIAVIADELNGRAATAAARKNVDGTRGSEIKGPGMTYPGYVPAPPYADNHDNTLADIAMYYWNRDLRTDLENVVPTSATNPAFWQHMRTFTVALGLHGTKDSKTKLETITTDFWPDPHQVGADVATRLDDLWHASINGRGGFFAASEPTTFGRELNNMLSRIVEENRRSAAAVTANSRQIEEGTLLYQARMTSGSWAGEFRAYEVDPATNEASLTPKWEAGKLIDPSTRKIFTILPSGVGKEFTWSALKSGAPETLTEDVVNYIRGDRSKEGTGAGKLRPRETLLGDIVNSTPEYVGGRNFMFNRLPGDEGATYKAWLSGREEHVEEYLF